MNWVIGEPGSPECPLRAPDSGVVLFFQVPDDKQAKNPAHMDLRARHSTRHAQIERAISLGASSVDDRRGDLGWAVLADPEGNEVCILDG